MKRYILFPLRLFLGITFVYAGIQKLGDPQFLNPTAIGYIGNQILAFAFGSPIHAFLLQAILPHASLFGIIVTLGEITIGLGALFGLLLRPAAFFGLVLSLIFFLSASWRVYPYFYGSDIVFVFAWLPLLLAGPLASGLPTLDGVLIPRLLNRLSPITHVWTRRLTTIVLGVSDRNFPSSFQLMADKQQPVQTDAEEVLSQRVPQEPISHQAPVLASRRSFFGGVLAGALGMLGIAIAGRTWSAGSTPTPANNATVPVANASATTTTTSGPANEIVQASTVPVNSAVSFTLPSNGDYGLLIHLKDGQFVCFDANCTHAGCPLDFDTTSSLLVCPCHGAQFDPAHNGKVVRGPAKTALTNVPINVDKANGAITLK